MRVGRLVVVALTICTPVAVSTATTDNRILFAAGTDVPRSVQEFAWRAIERRCSYQSHELRQRSFWAHDATTRRVGGSTVYSIEIVSDVPWKKTAPPAMIAITVVDDGRLHVTELTSSFITCAS